MMYDILLILLGYVMVVFGMYVNDFRQTLQNADTEIYIKKILIESLTIYLLYFLIAKDNIMNKTLSVWFLNITITEKTSLGLNLLMGIMGYDKIYKHFTKKIKIVVKEEDDDKPKEE